MASSAELLIILNAKDLASKQIEGLGKTLGGFGAVGKVAGAALAGFAVAGAGVAAGLGQSISAAMNFQGGMSAVAAVAGATADEMAQLSAKALQLGQDNTLAGIGATDAAAAMRELAAAGVSTQDILAGAARGALLLASAGGIDVARAAEIASNALTGFGLAGSQAGHVADLLAGAANASSADVGDLGESLKFVAPIAHSMGISIEDVVATLAELGSQGIKGSQAGTSLRAILASLADPSKRAAATIKDLGLQMFDSSGHMKDFSGISEELKTHMAGLTDQQRAQALATIFGNESLSAATILYGEGADGIKKYLDQVNVAGSAAANGAKRNDNLKGSIEQLKSSWETLSIVLGTAFIPVIRRVVDGAAGLISTIIGLKDTIGPAVAAILQGFKSGDFNNAFGPILAVIDKVFGEGTSGKVALFVSNVLTFVQNLRNGIVSFAGGIASGFGAVLGAIASLVTGQTTLAQFIGGMETFVTTVLGNLGKLASQAAPYLGMFLSAIGTFIAGAVPQIVAQMVTWATAFTGWITTTAIPYLQTNLPLWLTALSTWITGTALPAIGTFVGQIGTAFGGWITTTAIPYLTTNLPLWLTALQTWVTGTALPAITTTLQTLGTAFGDWVATSAVPWVQANLPGWVKAVTDWITSTALPAITTSIQVLAGALVSWIQGNATTTELGKWKDAIIGALADVLILLTAAVGILGPKLVEWIKAEETRTKFGEVVKAVGDGTADILNALNDFSANAGVAFRKWIDTAGPLWLHDWGEFGRVAKEGIDNILTGVIPGIMHLSERMNAWADTVLPKWLTDWGTLFTTVDTKLAEISKTVDTFESNLATAVGTWINTAGPAWLHDWGSLGEAVSSSIENVAKLAGTIPGRIEGAIGDLSTLLYNKGVQVVQGLINGITSMLGPLGTAVGNLASLIPGGVGQLLGIKSPSTVMAEQGRQIVEGLIVGMDEKRDEAAKKAAEVASAIAKAVIDTLGAMKALAGFDFAKNTPSGAQLGGFAAFVANTTAMIAEIGAQFSEEGLKAAGTFADAASKITGLIGGAVTALTAIGTYTPIAASAIYAFDKNLRSLMNDFALVAEQVTQEAADAAAKFATGALAVVDVVGKGADAFTKLGTYVAIPVAAIYAFGKTLRATINDFALLAEQVTQEATDAAAKFASGAGTVVDTVGKGVSAFLLLATYEGTPTAAIYAFGKTLRAAINDLALVAEQVGQEAVDAAAKFAASAGGVVALIGPAIEGLSKLADFVAPSRAAIDNLANAIFETVRRIGELASSMSADGIKSAGEFGTAAGSVLSALKTGLDVFTGMAKLVVPSRQAINDFAAGVAATVAQLGIVADQIGKDGIKKAADFGAAVQAVFGSLKSAMDMLTNLAKFKDVATKAFDSLLAGMQEAVQRAQGMVDQAKIIKLQSEEYAALMAQATANFAKGLGVSGSPKEIGRKLGEGVISGARDAVGAHSPAEKLAELGRDITAGLVMGMTQTQQDAVKAAADLASSVAKAIQDSLSAATALGKLDLTTLPTGGQITGLLGFTRALVAEMAASATMLNEDGVKQTSAFADAAGKVASAVNVSVTALTSLVTFVAPAGRAIFDFGKSLRTAVADLAALADELGVALAEKAATFSEQATKAIAIFGSGASGFTALIGYVRPASKAIYDFGKDLMLALGDLAAIVDLIGQDIAEKAGKFGEVASKAVAVIGGGAESFTKLKDYARIPTKAIYDFGKDLMALIADFAAIVDLIGVEVANKAGQFADGAGKAVTVVGTALGSFSGLATFVTPGKAAVDGLLATVRYIIARFGEMAQTMSTEGTKQLGDFGAATNAVLGGVKAAIDTFILLDKAVVPRTGDLSDLVVAVQGVTRNMASAAKLLGDDAIKDATAFGTAASGIFGALKSGLDLFAQIDKPGGWPTTDWLQPLIELMSGMLARGGQLLTQAQQLKAVADQFSATMAGAYAGFATGLGGGGLTLTGNVGGAGLIGGGGGGTTTVNNYYISGNTLLSKDTATQQQISGIVTATQGRTISYATSG